MTGRRASLSVNGHARSIAEVPDGERLLDTLRERWRLTGTKEGCRSGGCGACTVLVDGRSVLSCLTLTHEVAGASVLTIEGAASDRVGRKVQAAFEREGGLQCGYCTPGFVLALTGLLKERDRPDDPEALIEDLAGNLCRCTGYASIRRAALAAQESLR